MNEDKSLIRSAAIRSSMRQIVKKSSPLSLTGKQLSLSSLSQSLGSGLMGANEVDYNPIREDGAARDCKEVDAEKYANSSGYASRGINGIVFTDKTGESGRREVTVLSIVTNARKKMLKAVAFAKLKIPGSKSSKASHQDSAHESTALL